MIRIALVGSIGSGKSHIAKLFKFPVFNADLEVNKIYKKDKKVFLKFKKKLPNFFSNFPLKKQELISAILDNKKNLNLITKIIHPIVKRKLMSFIKNNKSKKIIILDIPLYLENKLNNKKDIIVFVKGNFNEVKKRLKKRKNYNIDLINQFKKIQLPIEKKKKKSDFIINNDFTMRTAKKYVKNILNKILHERSSIRY
tara:strand:- start:80 stop:673 length:594 start_codon:yes stop_codon:yes gene_type:complete